jgi:hypothetical protein
MIEPIKIGQSEESGEVDFSEILKQSFVDVKAKLTPQPIALSFGTHSYKGNDYPTPLGSYGDFICVVGASKSTKSMLVKAMTACYIGGKANYYFEGMKGHLNEGKDVVVFDTEQSLFHTQRGARQICEMVGHVYPKFHPYTLRSLDVEKRIGVFKQILKDLKDIGLMVIDGIADLVKNVNDLDECNSVVQMLMTASKDYQILIIVVLHKNFGSQKATGHLGSAVTKKAETVLSVEREDEITTVKPQYTRNRPFEKFSFKIDEETNLPTIIKPFNYAKY